MSKKVLFSGSAPTGTLTVGNYLGAIRQWVHYQQEYDCLFCVVDLHALTMPQDPATLRERTLDFVALFLACGLDPEEATIFVQSHNPLHAELSWILNGWTNHGELTRMTQFKDKSARSKTVTAGLLNYPILMAADILLYRTSLVPVGADQKQHVELARQIAQRFNAANGDLLTVPEAFIPQAGPRIKNLLDPTKKMDKSDPNPRTFLSLIDTPEDLRNKILKAKTDSAGSFPIADESEGITNLVTIYSAITNEQKESVAARFRDKGYAVFKNELADRLVHFLSPIQATYREIRPDGAFLMKRLAMGRDKAIDKSRDLMRRIREAVGLVSGTT